MREKHIEVIFVSSTKVKTSLQNEADIWIHEEEWTRTPPVITEVTSKKDVPKGWMDILFWGQNGDDEYTVRQVLNKPSLLSLSCEDNAEYEMYIRLKNKFEH